MITLCGTRARAEWVRPGQGYHLARPLPAAALARWLRESPWAAPGAQMD